MKKTRVVFYARVSKDTEEQLHSFEAQKKYFEEFISRNKDMVFIRGYTDEGISGVNVKKRKQFQQMIEDAKNSEFDLILTKEVTRFARNTVDTLVNTRLLLKYNVGVLFTTDNIDTRSNDGELRLSLMATLAQEESRKISSRVNWATKRNYENGVAHGTMPYGYKRENGKIVIVEDEAKVVQQIFRLYIDGYGTRRIANTLNEQGYYNATGGEWLPSTIRGMLKNRKYCGDLVQGMSKTIDFLEKKREVVKDESQYYVCVSHHDAIIDKQTFEYVQQLQENRKSINDKNEVKVPFKYSNQNIFSNKIFCGYCNASYRRIKRKNDSIYYKCSTADKKKRVFCPESENIKEEALKYIIKQTAQYFKVNEEDIIRQFEDVLKEIEMDLDEDSIQGIEEKIQSNRSKLEKLVDLYMEGLIDKEIYFHKKEEIEKETYELNQKMNMTSQTQVSVIQKVKNLIETIKDKLNHWRDMSDTLIKELIYKIVVYSKEKLDIYINVASYQKISYENGVFVLPNVSEME